MIRVISAYSLVLLLVITGFSLEQARGQSSDIGVEIVICSGVNMKTISIGADGQPVEGNQACPDGASMFTIAFALPQLVRPEPRLLATETLPTPVIFTSRNELSPSARGPPALA